MFETIGPVWDGNEVWLVVAGGATFAAFPAWYATMFSGFYLALLLVLVFLIVRVVSFEWREKSESPRWRATWMWANTIGSIGAALIWGVGLANLVYGVPIDSDGDFTGELLRPLQPVHGGRRARGRRALRVPRRDLPDAAHDRRPARARRATPRAGSPSRPRLVGRCASSSGRSSSRSTATTRTSSRRCSRPPPGSSRSSSPSSSSFAGRSGWAFTMTGARRRCCSSRRSSRASTRA